MSSSQSVPWSEHETKLLFKFWFAGLAVREIADRLGRNRNAVRMKVFRHGLPPRRKPGLRPQRQARIRAKCARCGALCFHETNFQRWCGPCRTWASKEESISW